MAWLLTGGAGYIGAHIARSFRAAGTDVVVLDNLSTGFREFIPEDVTFVDGSVTSSDDIERALDAAEISGVVHLAGLKYANVSVEQPLRFYAENVGGMQTLLETLRRRDVSNIVFSSSSSWYGTIEDDRVSEDAPAKPESPYGETKVISEWMLRDVAATWPELSQVSLRYFNVVGSGHPEIADHSRHALFPKVIRELTDGETPQVFGGDYPTPDGSCVRDYVHVADLADAHVAAAGALDEGRSLPPALNVGRGEGSTVFEVLASIREVTGIDFEPEVKPRRPGDPARVVGAVGLIERELGWRAQHDLTAMTSSSWAAWQRQLELWGGAPPDGARATDL